MKKCPFLGTNDPPWEFQKVTSLKILSLGMRTFLAGFCAPGSPLAKALGIFHEKQPLPRDQQSPLGISKSYLSKNLQLGDANISGGFLRSWRSSGKTRWDFAWGPTIPLGNIKKLPL